jgi:hypothetical protein
MAIVVIVVKFLGGLLTAFIIGYFVDRAQNNDTNGKLYFGGFMLGLALCCFAFSTGMVWVWFFTDHGEQDVPIAFLVFGFGGGFVYTFLEYFFTKGSYDSKGIEYSSPWSGLKQYSWKELEEIDYNEMSYWYVFEFSDGVKLRISSYMHGQKGLFEILDEYEESM